MKKIFTTFIFILSLYTAKGNHDLNDSTFAPDNELLMEYLYEYIDDNWPSLNDLLIRSILDNFFENVKMPLHTTAILAIRNGEIKNVDFAAYNSKIFNDRLRQLFLTTGDNWTSSKDFNLIVSFFLIDADMPTRHFMVANNNFVNSYSQVILKMCEESNKNIECIIYQPHINFLYGPTHYQFKHD